MQDPNDNHHNNPHTNNHYRANIMIMITVYLNMMGGIISCMIPSILVQFENGSFLNIEFIEMLMVISNE